MMRRDMQYRGAALLRQQHAAAQPRKVGSAQPLHGAESAGIGVQNCGDAANRQPQQYLIAKNHADGCADPAGNTTLARRGNQSEIARPRQHQEDYDGGDKGTVIDNPRHGYAVSGALTMPRPSIDLNAS